MKKLYAKISDDLEKELKKIESKNDDILILAEKSIEVIHSSLLELRKIVTSTKFKSEQEEIYFFKIVKPKVFSQLIYFVKLFKIEGARPKGSIKLQKKYFELEIKNMQEYFNANPILYQYYRRGEAHSDQQYFLSKNNSISFHFDCLGSYIDDDFATCLDSTFSKFIGYDLSIQYFQNEIEQLNINPDSQQQQISPKESNLNWTANKVDLVEIIYALNSVKAINNGEIDIKEMASTFETVFNIELGDYYRTFLEIKARKLTNTKFLNQLILKLTEQIEESEK